MGRQRPGDLWTKSHSPLLDDVVDQVASDLADAFVEPRDLARREPLVDQAAQRLCRGGSIVSIMTPRMSAGESGPGFSKYTASTSDDHVVLSRDTANTSS